MPANIANFAIDVSQWGAIGDTGTVSTDITKLQVWVQDEYSIRDEQQKIDTYNQANRYAWDGSGGILILNHLSCTNITDVRGLAGRVNPLFEAEYRDSIERIRGVTVMDFPTDNEIDMIIQSNGATQTRIYPQDVVFTRN